MSNFDSMGTGRSFGGNIEGEDGKFFHGLAIHFDVPVGMITHFEHDKTITAILRDSNLGGISLAADFFISDSG